MSPVLNEAQAAARAGAESFAALVAMLKARRYPLATEVALQDAVAVALFEADVDFAREWPPRGRDRLDFYLPRWNCGLELKTQGSPNVVLRQLHRYAGMAEIGRLLLLTTHARLGGLPATLRGKPLETVVLWEGGL